LSHTSAVLLTTVIALLLVGCGGGAAPPTQVYTPPTPAPPAPPVPMPEPAPLPPPPTAMETKEADKVYLAGFYADAYEQYRRRLLVNGDDLDAHDGLTRAAVKLGKLKETVGWYEKKLDSYSMSPSWCYGAARAMMQAGDTEQASVLCYRALKLGRTNRIGRAYFLLGLKYYTQPVPEYKTAWTALNKAVQYDPKYGPAYYHLAILEAKWRGNRVQAKALLSKGLTVLRPVEGDVRFLSHILLGEVLSSEDEKAYADALKHFEKARELGGDRVYDYVNFGRLYELMGEREKALKEWKDVQNRFGLASPTGLLAYRSVRRLESKVAVDYSNFLPGGDTRVYEVMVSHLLKPRATPAARVPATIGKLLNEIKTPVRLVETDIDGDGKVELTVVEVRQQWEPDVKGYYHAGSVLYVFTPKGGTLGFFDPQFDHFWDISLVDFNADGKKEIVFAAFNNPNIFYLVVMTQRGRRYLNTFAQPVQCTTGACGVLIDDLDDDGKLELLSVSGVDLWVSVMRWSEGGTFTDASIDFPEFYRDYVKQYEELKPEDLARWPVVQEHLEKARILAAGRVKESEKETTGK